MCVQTPFSALARLCMRTEKWRLRTEKRRVLFKKTAFVFWKVCTCVADSLNDNFKKDNNIFSKELKK